MDPSRDMEASQYVPSTSMPRGPASRVNPNYPLQSANSPPQNLTASSLPNGDVPTEDNGLSRSTSRRRKVSGQGNTRTTAQSELLPAAPDVPKAPPVSYRDPYLNADHPPADSSSSKSFAARARAIPSNADPVFTNGPSPDVRSAETEKRHSRRGSINRNSEIAYPEFQQPVQPSFSSSGEGPASPQHLSDATIPRQYKDKDRAPTHQAIDINKSRKLSDTASPPARFGTRRTSASAVEERSEWAADRSPLQKLEVKLNDISKEEKRARVQEAEQLLRETKAAKANRMAFRENDPAMDRASSRHVSDTKTRAGSKTSQDQGHQRDTVRDTRHGIDYEASRPAPTEGREQMTGQQRYRNTSGPTKYQPASEGISALALDQTAPQSRAVHARRTSTDYPDLSREGGRGVRFQNHNNMNESAEDSMPESPVGVSVGTRPVNPAGGGVEPPSPRDESRFSQQQQQQQQQQSQRQGEGYAVSRDSSKQVPDQQQQLYGSKAEQSKGNDSAAAFGGAPDPVPRDSVRRHGHGPKYEVSPQTASGVDARHKVGFGSRQDSFGEGSTHREHHISGFLRHGHHDTKVAPAPFSGPQRHLDEWRQGSVARLTLADFATDGRPTTTNKAWWEGDKLGSYRRSSGSRPTGQGMSSVDGGYEDNSGMVQLRPLFSENFSTESVGEFRRNGVAVRARQYIGYDGTSRVRRRYRSWFRQPASLLSLRISKAPQILSSSMYLHPAPQLTRHDLFHFEHIHRPPVKKKLTRSMRYIRVRVPAASSSFNPPLYLKCGPLLRYTGLRRDKVEHARSRSGTSVSERETWRGSVMIVTVDADSSYDPVPTLRLFHQPMNLLPPPPQQLDGESADNLPFEYVDPIAGLPKLSRTGRTVYVKPIEDLDGGVDVSRIENDEGLYEETRTANVPTSYGKADELLGRGVPPPSSSNRMTHRTGKQSGRYQEVRGVRLHAERGVTFWRFSLEVELGNKEARIAYSINKAASIGFWVPARGQTMNLMFHSCNGFSMSVNSADFSGPDPLWRDVLNAHQTRPFHAMIGGGDQIYNDAVMKQTTLFQEWLSINNPHRKHEAQFSPQMQDELENFYLDRYSMWFSQGLFGMANAQIPMINMWDDHDIIDGFGSYPHHFMSTPVFCGLGNVAFKYYMLFQHQSVADESQADEPSWLLGTAPGPYINELSRNMFMFLGKHVAFLGLDCRTERMREEILSEASYAAIFDRCRREIIQGETRHLIVLLGVPIAYPRLVWLENILTSRAMDPIKAMGKAGLLGNFLNKFDGGVEILDDLDDHWTARNHKDERNWFIQKLQDIAAEKSVRVTILGGDVHLAAVGQFYSNPKLRIPKDRDHRYMPNVISSAIVNTPPPEMMGDILNKRNKVHHLDHDTDEDMIPMFTHDVDGKPRNNKRLLPRRNWCSIREYHPGSTPPTTPPENSLGTPDLSTPPLPRNLLQRSLSLTKGDAKPANLFRRLSQRGAPASPDWTSSEITPTGRASVDGYFPTQPNDIATKPGANSNGNGGKRIASAPLPIRPIGNFHRRPTNLSERAAKRGGPGQFMGQINLEEGLDIVINCEVSQKNPAGNTVPYRLLVPALWYQSNGDGSSDGRRERKESWFSRLGSRRGTSLARKQGQGNWGGESESGSDSDSERGDGRADWQFASGFRRQGQVQGGGGGGNGGPRVAKQFQPVATPPVSATHPVGSRNAMAPRQQSMDRGQAFAPVASAAATRQPMGMNTEQQATQGSPLGVLGPTNYGQVANGGRIGGKFDANGQSKFFGTQNEIQGGGTAGPSGGGGGGREGGAGEGYSGIEAYREKEKGWRRFF